MALSDADLALIKACGEQMAAGTSGGIDLFSINNGFFRNHDEITQVLAATVEQQSGGTLTVRRVSADLFSLRVKGPALYVACGSVGANLEDEVQAGRNNTKLYMVGPYSSGLQEIEPIVSI